MASDGPDLQEKQVAVHLNRREQTTPVNPSNIIENILKISKKYQIYSNITDKKKRDYEPPAKQKKALQSRQLKEFFLKIAESLRLELGKPDKTRIISNAGSFRPWFNTSGTSVRSTRPERRTPQVQAVDSIHCSGKDMHDTLHDITGISWHDC